MISRRALELTTATLTGVFGAAVVISSIDKGIGWSTAGVDGGTFPFLTGLIVVIASLWNLARGWLESRAVAVSSSDLRHLIALFAPAVVFVAAIPLVGVYVASGCYMLGTLALLHRFSLPRSLLIAVTTPIALYLAFERMFQVSLPHGALADVVGCWPGRDCQLRILAARLDDRNRAAASGVDAHRRAAGDPGRRAAGAWCPERRLPPVAFDIRHAAGFRDHLAVQHVLGRAVRRLRDVDPVQYSRRAIFGRDHLRRLSDGARWPRDHRACDCVRIRGFWRACRGRADYVSRLLGRPSRSRIRAAGIFRGLLSRFRELCRNGRGSAGQNGGLAGRRLCHCRHRHRYGFRQRATHDGHRRAGERGELCRCRHGTVRDRRAALGRRRGSSGQGRILEDRLAGSLSHSS